MVAKITTPATVKRALNYNEQKVRERKAECIYAHNYLKDAAQLNFHQKLDRFERLIAMNKRASTNAVHISLNFAPNERFAKEELSEIATLYMEIIGFGQQPFLVYQHSDAGHPHIHILSTTIQQSGKRISLHNIGRNESAKARKEIEIRYNLTKADDQNKRSGEKFIAHVKKVNYGKAPTKRAITNVLDVVLPHYKYESLPELNAILKLYNVKADRGNDKGIIFAKKGLLYRVLDEHGNSIGVPIKASSIYNHPTLNFLEKYFEENKSLKLPYRKKIKTKLDWILITPPKSLDAFKELLEKENISLVIRQNDRGDVYGLTYIDHVSKCVFNGSDIGKQYSAKFILERCQEDQPSIGHERAPISRQNERQNTAKQQWDASGKSTHLIEPLDRLLSPANSFDPIPYELKKSKKKKRKL